METDRTNQKENFISNSNRHQRLHNKASVDDFYKTKDSSLGSNNKFYNSTNNFQNKSNSNFTKTVFKLPIK